jgi:deazaflavin-dependent oxidoreductase (nitroreductase family)
MTGQNDLITNGPPGNVERHIRAYVETDGRNGHRWRDGALALLITTIGRKTGLRRRTALIYGMDGDQFIIVASRRGHNQHPAWYLNLLTHPEIEVQVGPDKFTALARTASPVERERLWPMMVSIWPSFSKYQIKTDRVIPVVVLTRTC